MNNTYIKALKPHEVYKNVELLPVDKEVIEKLTQYCDSLRERLELTSLQLQESQALLDSVRRCLKAGFEDDYAETEDGQMLFFVHTDMAEVVEEFLYLLEG